MSPLGGQIHPTATVEEGAEIGPGTFVWHYVHVRSGARIGPHCVLGMGVYVDHDVTLGARVRLQNHVSVYAGVTLGDDVFVGPSAVFTNDCYPRAGSADWEIIPTRVEQGASIGANATVICGITLAEWSMVGAGSVVTQSTSPHELVVGNPARHHGWVCSCGRPLTVSGPEAPVGHCRKCILTFRLERPAPRPPER